MTHAQACAALFAKAERRETYDRDGSDCSRSPDTSGTARSPSSTPSIRRTSFSATSSRKPASRCSTRSHTSRAGTHDPRSRARHPNHPVRPAHRTPPSAVPRPWPSPIFWNILRCSSTSHSTPPTKERNHPCPSQSSSPSAKSCGICSPPASAPAALPFSFAYHCVPERRRKASPSAPSATTSWAPSCSPTRTRPASTRWCRPTNTRPARSPWP